MIPYVTFEKIYRVSFAIHLSYMKRLSHLENDITVRFKFSIHTITTLDKFHQS